MEPDVRSILAIHVGRERGVLLLKNPSDFPNYSASVRVELAITDPVNTERRGRISGAVVQTLKPGNEVCETLALDRRLQQSRRFRVRSRPEMHLRARGGSG